MGDEPEIYRSPKKRYKQKEEICRKFRESKYKKDGEVYKVFNKEIEVGVYVVPGHLNNFNHTMKSNHAQLTNGLLKHVSGKLPQ